MRVLIIEDDPEIQAFLRKGLSEEGFAVESAYTASDGEAHASMSQSDVIVLDLMIPGGDGLQLCANLRKKGITTPVLMLTARDALDDRVAGLNSGADDYLVKPYAFPELVARLRALGRRQPTYSDTSIQIGDLLVNQVTRKVTRDGKIIDLSPKEYGLLEYMARHSGQALSRTQIAEQVWGMGFAHDSNVVDVYIAYLRRKIDNGFDSKLIHTVRGYGYKLANSHP